MNMITSIVCIALIGTLQFNFAISATINYEPIKITVNEHFNAQSGQVFPELQAPDVLHQGANFYFKPQLNLPPSYIPSHIEGLISLIQQHHHSWSKDASKVILEKDKLIEILKPFMYPMSEISKETLSEFVLEKENNLEIVKPIIITEELKPITPELLVISEAPELPPLSFNGIPPIIEEQVKKEESVILEESTGLFPTIPEIAMRPITKPIINYVEPKPITSGLVVIPEAQVLPPLSANGLHVVEEEVKIEEPMVVEVEPKPAVQELIAIPEDPVLPSLSLHDISSMIEVEKKEELVIFENLTRVFPTIPEIDVRPIGEPIINYIELKPITSELVVIPEAPVLPALSINNIPPILEEEVKKEESIILEAPTGVFPTIPEIAVRPITEPIINYVESQPITSELLVIPEAPVLAPLSANDIHIVEKEVKIEEQIAVDIESKPAIQELVAIPEVPVLSSVSLQDISFIIEEEVKKEESVIFEEPTGVFPSIPEISARPEMVIIDVEPKPAVGELLVIPEAPVLAPLSANDIHIVEEEVKIEKPIVVDVEPKPAIQELVAIPESPVLPSLSLHDISSIIEEEAKKEKAIVFEKPMGVFPSIPEISAKPETVIVNVESKPAVEELLVIPKAPVVPLLSDIPAVEKIQLNESPPLSKITDVKPRPITPGLVVIPEAPVLPQLSHNGIPPVVEDVKIEESTKVEESIDVFPSISEISARPFPEPSLVSETAESFALENNIFPIATEKVKIEVPALQESEITASYELEEVSQPNPKSVVTIKETLPPTIIPKPSNNMGVFSYVPFVSHIFNRAPKAKKLMIPKPASVERFLLKKHPFRLPVTPFPKPDLNAIKSSIWRNKKQFYIPRPTHMMLLKNSLPQTWRLKNRMLPNM